MGTRLRNLVKNTVEEKKVIKKKTLTGIDNFPGKFIDKLTVYFGLDIRRNSNSVINMKNAIWVTFDHNSSTDSKAMHQRCLRGPESWCSWQKAKAARKLKSYKQDFEPLKTHVLDAIRPIYEELSKYELLERCLRGCTQNNNESFNQLVWKITPKSLPGGFKVIELVTNIATCTFNEGE